MCWAGWWTWSPPRPHYWREFVPVPQSRRKSCASREPLTFLSYRKREQRPSRPHQDYLTLPTCNRTSRIAPRQLQIFRPQTRMLRNLRQNDRSQFLFVVVGETILRPSDRKSTRLNSSHVGISYAVFC